MKEHIEEIRNDVADMKKSVEELYYALVGNSVLKDGGLVKRFVDLELKVLEQSKKYEQLKENYNQLKWMALGMALGAGLLGFSLKDIVHFFIK